MVSHSMNLAKQTSISVSDLGSFLFEDKVNNDDTLQEPAKTEEQRFGSLPTSTYLIYNLNQS